MKNKIKENLHSDFVERKQEIENEEQLTQENTVEKKTSIVMKESKLKSTGKNTTRKYNSAINKYNSSLKEEEAKEEAENIKCKEIKEKSRELFLGNVRNSWKKMKRIGKN